MVFTPLGSVKGVAIIIIRAKPTHRKTIHGGDILSTLHFVFLILHLLSTYCAVTSEDTYNKD